MAPGKKAEIDAMLDVLREEVNKIGVVERSMEDLKESVMEIRNRMSVMERLEKRLDETEETRKKEFAALFQATLQSQMEEEISPPIKRPGKQIATEEEGSGLFRAGTSGFRSESVTRMGEARRELENDGRNRSQSHHDLQWQQNELGPDDLPRKLKIPIFDGESAESWVLRVEQYFELGEFSEERKLRVVRMCFDGEALMWYRWERDRNPFVSWDQMKYRVLEQISTNHETTARERLMTLKQEGTVREYIKDFISLASNAPELSDTVLETAFMIGLKPQIKAGVKLMEPRSLRKMMSVAKLVEEWVNYGDPSTASQTMKGAKGGSQTMSSSFPTRNGPNLGSGSGSHNNQRPKTYQGQEKNAFAEKKPANQNSNYNGRSRTPFRRLSLAEYARYKAEGLCFQCGEKSHARRDCPNKELMVLVVQEEDGDEKDQEEEAEKVEEEVPEFAECAVLSTRSAMGISSPKTIKLRRSVQEVQAIVLIDSGATHNFIDSRLMRELGLVAEETQSFGVITGSGKPVRGGGICRNVTLTMQGYSITTDFLPLDLNNVDIILGIQWLETLGEMRVNWKLQTLKIPMEGKLTTLQGVPDLCSSEVSFKAVRKLLEQTEVSVVVECRVLLTKEKGKPGVPTTMQKLLSRYEQVFAEPQGLPPSRGREHEGSFDTLMRRKRR